MFSPTIEVLLKAGVPNITLVFILSLPVIFTLINFARYIIGVKTVGTYSPVAITFAFYSIGAALIPYHIYSIESTSEFIFQGLRYGYVIIIALFITTILAYDLVKKVNLHYMPKISLVLISLSFTLLLILFVGAKFEQFTLLRIDPLAFILFVIIGEQFLSIYIKNSFNSALSLTISTVLLSTLCFVLMALPAYQQFILNHIWIALLLAVVNLLIGKYTGLRLTEYIRFYNLLETDPNESASDMEE